jgi:hypothetical protein
VETDSETNIPERDGHGAVGHVPVLLKEAIDFLAVKRGGTYLDATVGLADTVTKSQNASALRDI